MTKTSFELRHHHHPSLSLMPDSCRHPLMSFDRRSLHQARTTILFFIALAAFFILYSDLELSRTSLYSLRSSDDDGADREPADDRILQPNFNLLLQQLQSVQEELEPGDDLESLVDEDPHSLVPPVNVTEEERIAWFRLKLPEFHIFVSDNSTTQFHSRVRQFFDGRCKLRFFMTWILPAGLFRARELLAMETLFKTHPHGCLLIISRTLDSRRGLKIIKPLLDRGFKILAAAPDLNFLLSDTPAESWFTEIKSGNKDPGEIPLAQNLSNLIRLAVLYKYGGVYLDTDFIVIRDFSGLRNSIGAQSVDLVSGNWTRINNAVMVFDANHPLLYKFIEEFALTFDGNKWGHNGPYLVSRVVQRVQGRAEYNFTVLTPMAFYPVDWTRIGGLFKQPENRGEERWVEAKLLQLSGYTFGVHLWNKQSSGVKIEEGSVIGRLISDHCLICKEVYSG